MPRSTSEVVFQNFNKGLHTESSPFAFPTDALFDVDNVVLQANGLAKRRFGIDYEAGYALTPTEEEGIFPAAPISSYQWERVNNDAGINLGIVQVYGTLYVYDLDELSPSNALLYTLLLTGFTSTPSPISYAAIEGYLVITSANLDSVYRLTWTGSALTETPVAVKVRDFWGVTDNLAVDARQTPSLSDPHKYNLLNQGWSLANITTYGSPYPSNAQVSFIGKDSSDVFQKAWLDKQDFGTTPAPKGRFIIRIKNRGQDRALQSGVTSLGSDSEQSNFTVVGSFAGRVFYAGLDSNISVPETTSPNTTAMVFYTKLVSKVDDLAQCYSDADPTSEHDSTLVPTDGGYLKLAGAGSVIHMQELAGRMIVFATNGVWEVFGGDGQFSADNYVTRQVSDIPALSSYSILSAEGSILFFANTGIYAVLPDPSTGRMSVQNAISQTIQSAYRNIPHLGKQYARGFYDASAKEARWLYGDYPTYFAGGNFQYKYNKELIMNVVTRSWTKNSFDITNDDAPFVMGYLKTPASTQIINESPILAEGDTVMVGTDPVIITTTVEGNSASEHRYLTGVLVGTNYNITLSELNDTNFLDWDTAVTNGQDYSSYMETGEIPFGDIF